MKTLRDESAGADLIRRLEILAPNAKPAWGRLTAGRMVCHLTAAARMARGELPTAPRPRGAFTVFPLKHLLLYVLPMPKNVGTAPELLAVEPTSFDQDRRSCAELIRRFAQSLPDGKGPRHPFFGVLTWKEWGVLQWRHTSLAAVRSVRPMDDLSSLPNIGKALADELEHAGIDTPRSLRRLHDVLRFHQITHDDPDLLQEPHS